MATLVKIRGLDRISPSTDSPVSRGYRGFRVKSQFTQVQGGTSMVKATLSITNQLTVTALTAGTWGNSVTFATAVGGSTPVVATTYASSTGLPTITVTAPATATLAANTLIVNAINTDPLASQFVVAALVGTGAAANGSTSAALSTGSNGSNGTQYPIWIRTGQNAPVIVDIDDPQNVRILRRNYNRFISLGAA